MGGVRGAQQFGVGVQDPRAGVAAGGERREGLRGLVQQERDPVGVREAGAPQPWQRVSAGGGVVGEGAQYGVQEFDACWLCRGCHGLFGGGGFGVLGDGLTGAALALLQDPLHAQSPGE